MQCDKNNHKARRKLDDAPNVTGDDLRLKINKMSRMLCVFLGTVYLISVAATTFISSGGFQSDGLQKLPRYVLNLDLPEEDRWQPILKHWDAELYRKYVESMLRYNYEVH